MPTYDILLVEDSPADVRLVREAMRAAAFAHTLHVVTSGDAALDFLRSETEPRPSLILLDLNLPGLDGREVLAQVKADPALRQIPVLVLTTSTDAQDIFRAYDLHANCYLVKPSSLDEFENVVASIEEHWLRWAKLPPAPSVAS